MSERSASTEKGEIEMTQAITTRSVALSAQSKRVLTSVTRHLEAFFRRVLRIEWTIDTSGRGIEVHLKVHARSGHYRAHCCVNDVDAGIRLAADRVERQRRRKKKIDLREKRRSILSPKARLAKTSNTGKSAGNVLRDWQS